MDDATVTTISGHRVLTYGAGGPSLASEDDAVALLATALGQRADAVVVPAALLPDDFFRLRTRLAGAIVQKFVTYRVRLVIGGDISGHLAGSDALRAFVREANRGRDAWFVADAAELSARLRDEAGGR